MSSQVLLAARTNDLVMENVGACPEGESRYARACVVSLGSGG